MRNLLLFALSCVPLFGAGCQCCALTERYNDCIDDVSDTTCCYERFYYPKLDLTRINMPDGIQCCSGSNCCNCCR